MERKIKFEARFPSADINSEAPEYSTEKHKTATIFNLLIKRNANEKFSETTEKLCVGELMIIYSPNYLSRS